MNNVQPNSYCQSLQFVGIILLAFFFTPDFCLAGSSYPENKILKPFKASPSQVLVLYNADWPKKSDGISADQDSLEIANYYIQMHTDPRSGEKPYLLGLTCQHFAKRHLNNWFIAEDSNDNKNGIIFSGQGSPPDNLDWARNSQRIEIWVTDPDSDWDSALFEVTSEKTGEKAIITPLRSHLKIAGIPDRAGDNVTYPAISNGKGRSYRFDATSLFRGTITVHFTIKNRSGETTRDLELRYFDIRDFVFSPLGKDKVADDKNVSEDVLDPVKKFLADPKNARPDGTLLKDHVLYIIVVHGMPFAGKGAYGIDHGATARRNDHGSLASLEQRLQTMLYPWQAIKPPVISYYMEGGPDADKGVKNHIVTSAMRRPLEGIRWNPYQHPDTYSFLSKNRSKPTFQLFPPFAEQRANQAGKSFAYAVTRIDGSTIEDAKRIIDYSLYASRYLRPEIDCRVRQKLAKEGKSSIPDLRERLKVSSDKNLWGFDELQTLGFPVVRMGDNQGVPFLARPTNDENCEPIKADWKANGFYPGGIDRHVVSSNGLNYKEAAVWEQIRKGVTVSAAGAPAYGGGPHITNTTFWDNEILLKYLFRGRDLGEAFLRSILYVNWSTSLIGDPLYHPDLNETKIDTTPPRPARDLAIQLDNDKESFTAEFRIETTFVPTEPEVALLKVSCLAPDGAKQTGISTIYSRRPLTRVKDLRPNTSYTVTAELIDPYGNRTLLPTSKFETGSIFFPFAAIKDLLKQPAKTDKQQLHK